MVRYIKGKNGKFAGSLPDKVSVPTAAVIPRRREETPVDNNQHWGSQFETFESLREQAQEARIRGIARDDLLREGFTETELTSDPSIIERRVAQQRLVENIPGTVTLDPPGSQADQYDLGDDGRPRNVYYASFGSNLFAHRFNLYVEGGQPEGSIRNYPGCRDSTPPSDDIPVALNGTIHYAGNSQAWNGGVAFLDIETSGKSLGRAYRITADQFDDVVAQEGNEEPGSRRTDLCAVMATGKQVEPGAYGTLVHVGDYNGSPVFTFTGPFSTAQARSGNTHISPDGRLVNNSSPTDPPKDDGKKPWPVFSNRPSDPYKNMIASGLAETHGLSREEAETYFAGSTGYHP